MTNYIGIAIIIITVAYVVHFVFEKGRKIGKEEGRVQILKEELVKADMKRTVFDQQLLETFQEVIGAKDQEKIEQRHSDLQEERPELKIVGFAQKA